MRQTKGGIRRAAERVGIDISTASHNLHDPYKVSLGRFYQFLESEEEEPEEWIHRNTASLDVRALLGQQHWNRPPNLVRQARRAANLVPMEGVAEALPRRKCRAWPLHTTSRI
jgi:hypothetical protein